MKAKEGVRFSRTRVTGHRESILVLGTGLGSSASSACS